METKIFTNGEKELRISFQDWDHTVRERQVENRTKIGKFSIFQSFEDKFSHLSLNGKNGSHFTILTQNIRSNLEIEQKINKKCF